MTARSTSPAKKDELVLYRLGEVEKAVKSVDEKVTNLNSPTKADYIELRETILVRINEIRDGLQKQIDEKYDDLEKQLEKKADKSRVDDLATLIKAFASVFTTVIAGLILFYLTKGQ